MDEDRRGEIGLFRYTLIRVMRTCSTRNRSRASQKHEPLRLIVRRQVFTARQITRLKGSRRLKTIHPEQLQLALEGQADSVYGYSFILTDIPPAELRRRPPRQSTSTATGPRSKSA